MECKIGFDSLKYDLTADTSSGFAGLCASSVPWEIASTSLSSAKLWYLCQKTLDGTYARIVCNIDKEHSQ